eukprot:TRINITY_DN3114_c0_g1_i1.p1 TRINITY_DN3114_c0_g1~~TRINITY_DN3114_c0_g1_i1.p1  ORF type:complete len:451 (+),score=87.99 TRINITY_DN3114_c0_g1_i1:26-1354(+)
MSDADEISLEQQRAWPKRRRVWVDKSEENEATKIKAAPAWTQLQTKAPKANKEELDSDADSDDEGNDNGGLGETLDRMLRSTGKLAAYRGGGRLPPTTLMMRQRPDANYMSRHSVAPSCLKFHPVAASNILLTAAPDHTVRLFRLGDKKNEILQRIHIQGIQPRKCVFSPNGAKIYVSGGSSKCCIIDTETFKHRTADNFLHNHQREQDLRTFALSPDGQSLAFLNPTGFCFVVSSKTFTSTACLKMGERVNDVTFDPDAPHYMYVAGAGTVYTWDVRNTAEHLSVLRDEGALDCRRVAVSHGHVAVGSEMGIVNVYNKPAGGCFPAKATAPLKVLKNVTHAIDQLGFNHDGQILHFGSSQSEGQIRLAHTGSLTAFRNFPGPLGDKMFVAADFSPTSDSLALATMQCRVTLTQLLHYGSASSRSDSTAAVDAIPAHRTTAA